MLLWQYIFRVILCIFCVIASHENFRYFVNTKRKLVWGIVTALWLINLGAALSMLYTIISYKLGML